MTKEGQRKKQGYCRAGNSLSARNKVWQGKKKKKYKNKMLIFMYQKQYKRD